MHTKETQKRVVHNATVTGTSLQSDETSVDVSPAALPVLLGNEESADFASILPLWYQFQKPLVFWILNKTNIKSPKSRRRRFILPHLGAWEHFWLVRFAPHVSAQWVRGSRGPVESEMRTLLTLSHLHAEGKRKRRGETTLLRDSASLRPSVGTTPYLIYRLNYDHGHFKSFCERGKTITHRQTCVDQRINHGRRYSHSLSS